MHAPRSEPSTRIIRHGFVAEVIVGQNGAGEIFHYIIQREGSREILHWGQEVSFERALDCIDEFLADRRKKQR